MPVIMSIILVNILAVLLVASELPTADTNKLNTSIGYGMTSRAAQSQTDLFFMPLSMIGYSHYGNSTSMRQVRQRTNGLWGYFVQSAK